MPTHQVSELLRDIEVAFVSLDKVGKSIAALKGEEPTAVGLAAPGIFCFELLPRALGALRAHYSSCSVHLHSGSYPQAARCSTGAPILGLSACCSDGNVFEWRPVAMARNVCLIYPGHRFEQKDLVVAEDLVSRGTRGHLIPSSRPIGRTSTRCATWASSPTSQWSST